MKTKQTKTTKNGKIARANGAPANTKKAAKQPAKKVAKPTVKKVRITVLGHTLTQFCRALGKAGFKAADAIKAIHKLAPKAPETTIRSQIGKAKAPDSKLTLKRVEIAQMRKLAA
jgi:hypothetical protein